VRGKALFMSRTTRQAVPRDRGDVTITDIGTVFQVTDDAEAGFVDVLVSEGAVDVEAGVQRHGPAGNRARFPRAAGAASVSPIQPGPPLRSTGASRPAGGSNSTANRSARRWRK
jgi:transmembrane sensor